MILSATVASIVTNLVVAILKSTRHDVNVLREELDVH